MQHKHVKLDQKNKLHLEESCLFMWKFQHWSNEREADWLTSICWGLSREQDELVEHLLR